MASQSGFVENEAYIIEHICQPHGCVYSRRLQDEEGRPRCSVKYSDEAVLDFVGDGCYMAAIEATNPNHVIPGVMTKEGFTPFSNASPLTVTDHCRGMESVYWQSEERGKVVFVAGVNPNSA